MRSVVLWVIAGLVALSAVDGSRAWRDVGRWAEDAFRDRGHQATFTILDYGAERGGDVTPALVAALKRCARDGGGRVVIPSGEWRCSPFTIPAGVTLHFDGNAELRCEDALSQALITIVDARGVAISGNGRIRGSDGARGPCIEIRASQQVSIHGLRLRHWAGTAIRVVDSSQVAVRSSDIEVDNGDALAVAAGREILIERCAIRAGAAALRVDTFAGGKVASERVVMRDCRVASAQIGVDVSGPCTGLFVERCHFEGYPLDYAWLVAPKDGATVSGVYLRQCSIDEAREAVLKIAAADKGVVEKVAVAQMACRRARRALDLVAEDDGRIEDILVSDSRFVGLEASDRIVAVGGLESSKVSYQIDYRR
ncbi:MAG: right-handed parallel beta-helix repeat-containing protein [Planctomycetota bacterium]|jgi:hypothetical protein